MNKSNKKIIIVIFLALTFLFLRYFITNSPYRKMVEINHENCKKLEIGMTTDQVLNLMGKPSNATLQTHDSVTEVEYDYATYVGASYGIELTFNTDRELESFICGDSGYYKGQQTGLGFSISKINSIRSHLRMDSDKSAKVEIYKFYEKSRTNTGYSFSKDGVLTDVYVIEIFYHAPVHSESASEQEVERWTKDDIANGFSTRKDYNNSNLDTLDEKVKQEGYETKEKLYKELGFSY